MLRVIIIKQRIIQSFLISWVLFVEELTMSGASKNAEKNDYFYFFLYKVKEKKYYLHHVKFSNRSKAFPGIFFGCNKPSILKQL
jgi:hypothetical protein